MIEEKVYEFKLSYEKLKRVKSEFEIGSLELDKRIHEETYVEKKEEALLEEVTKKSNEKVTRLRNKVLACNDNIKPWVKTLYKKIMVSTHPDKITKSMPSFMKENLNKNFEIAKEAYENNNSANVLMTAHNIGIDISELDIELDFLDESIMNNKKETEIIKNKAGWVWYNSPSEEKEILFKQMIKIFNLKIR